MNEKLASKLREVGRRFFGLRADKHGAIIIAVAVVFPVLLAFTAFSLDVGMMYDWKRRQKAATIAAAMGASHEMFRQSQVSLADAKVAAKLAGIEDAKRNNFDDADANRNITVTVNIPPTSGIYLDDPDFVEVFIEEVVPSYFARVFGQETVTIRSRNVAGFAGYADACVIALEPTATETFVASGTPTLDADCGIAVNSTDDEAMVTNGQPSCVFATVIGVTGGYTNRSNTPCIDPYPIQTPPVVDPLSHLTPIEVSNAGGCIVNTNISNGTHSLSPGRYCGTPENEDGVVEYRPAIKISGGTVTFEAGLYVLDAGIDITGNSVIRGSGVTFYNTNKQEPYQGNMDAWVTISIEGTVDFQVTAPTAGDYTGVLFWEDPDAPEWDFDDPDERRFHFFGGNQTSIWGGALYFPSSQVRWAGTGTAADWTMIVSDTIKIVGNAVVPGQRLNTGNANPFLKVTLVE